MRVLSLGGAGAVCQYATRDLAEFSDFVEIVRGDTVGNDIVTLRRCRGNARVADTWYRPSVA